ncbi:DUF1439 domain-containing protein [Pasteurellaceae bacterium LIM206]|nr:DUF1439 domain-containing protein [Pasteurellaceae bacterium LIM206]
MQRLRRFYRYLLLCFLFFSPAVQANLFSVSEQEVNDYLAKKGDISDKLGMPGLFQIDYDLQNLSAKIGQADKDRIEISGTIDGLFNLGKQNYVGKIDLVVDTIPYYNAEQGAVYLKDLRIKQWSGSPQQYMEKINPVMPLVSRAIATLLTTMPIYTLDESKPRDLLIKKFAKGIRVEQGKLSLETEIL